MTWINFDDRQLNAISVNWINAYFSVQFYLLKATSHTHNHLKIRQQYKTTLNKYPFYTVNSSLLILKVATKIFTFTFTKVSNYSCHHCTYFPDWGPLGLKMSQFVL